MKLESATLSRLYLLAAFSTLLLAMGQGMGLFAIVMLAAAVAAYVLTERRGKYRLSERAANLLAGIAAGLFLVEISLGGIFTLAIAHLAVYMQLIVLFQKKSLRSYWHLVLLALMQVPVAAVMNLRMWFGVLLVGYLFMALFTLALFYLYRESLAYKLSPAPVLPPGPSLPNHPWPLAGMPSQFVGSIAGQCSAKPWWLGLRWRIGWLGLLTLPLAVAFFLLSPRAPTPGWAEPMDMGAMEMGFAPQVTLGEIGQFLESDEPVMKVTLRNTGTGENSQPLGELLFRGAVLLDYDAGRWASPAPEQIGLLPPAQGPGLVCQEIELEPIDSPVLFAAGRLRGGAGWNDSQLEIDQHTSTLLRPEQSRNRSIHYRAYTSADGLYAPYVRARPLRPRRRQRALELPRNRLPAVVQTAERLVAGISPGAVEQRARKLESYLLSSEFSYVLAGEVVDANLDPVEDFLRNRKSGHCEYFASALALMLRAVDIPARVVSGFRGGEWNRVGQFLQVRQKHAHTWVEAFVPGTGEGWLTLDPTPSQMRELPARSIWMRLREYRSFFQALWSRHVVGFDARQQRGVLASPVASLVSAWRRWGQEQLTRPALVGRDQVPWEVALMLFGVVLIGLGLTSMIVTRSRSPGGGATGRSRLRGWLRFFQTTSEQRRTVRVDFYERLSRLLARHRWVRQPEQTPREFAVALSSHLETLLTDVDVARYPCHVVEAYYEVRFGGKQLTPQARRRIRTMIGQLARALQSNRSTDSPAD